jgi:hypothetical protein
MITSSMDSGGKPLRSTAARTAMLPSCTALKGFSAPKNLPCGKRAPLTITTSVARFSSVAIKTILFLKN